MKKSFGVLPLDYYYECINRLKEQFKNFTIFIFSNNLQWAKDNLKMDVPVEFVDNVERDVDELFLMSLCKHNIIANSTFSWWGAWINNNPDKQVLAPDPWFRNRTHNHDILPESWIKIPVNYTKSSDINMKPIYSIILFIDDNISTIVDSLGSIIFQEYEYYEVIIIDNASTDGSNESCRKAVSSRNNVSFIKLDCKISKYAAWNMGIKMAQGDYIMFLDGRDIILSSTLSIIYLVNQYQDADIIHSVGYFLESNDGDISIANRKFVILKDRPFQTLPRIITLNMDNITKLKVLISQDINLFLGTKIFRREFLINNKISFKVNIEDNVEMLFLIECMHQTSRIMFIPQIFYISQNKSE